MIKITSIDGIAAVPHLSIGPAVMSSAIINFNGIILSVLKDTLHLDDLRGSGQGSCDKHRRTINSGNEF